MIQASFSVLIWPQLVTGTSAGADSNLGWPRLGPEWSRQVQISPLTWERRQMGGGDPHGTTEGSPDLKEINAINSNARPGVVIFVNKPPHLDA